MYRPAAPPQATRDWQDYVSPDSEYYATPPHILAAVRKVFGGPIDLDPASDDKVRRGHAEGGRAAAQVEGSRCSSCCGQARG